eukprot:PhF_6_TR18638/c0_g1_i1/m.27244
MESTLRRKGLQSLSSTTRRQDVTLQSPSLSPRGYVPSDRGALCSPKGLRTSVDPTRAPSVTQSPDDVRSAYFRVFGSMGLDPSLIQLCAPPASPPGRPTDRLINKPQQDDSVSILSGSLRYSVRGAPATNPGKGVYWGRPRTTTQSPRASPRAGGGGGSKEDNGSALTYLQKWLEDANKEERKLLDNLERNEKTLYAIDRLECVVRTGIKSEFSRLKAKTKKLEQQLTPVVKYLTRRHLQEDLLAEKMFKSLPVSTFELYLKSIDDCIERMLKENPNSSVEVLHAKQREEFGF